LRSPVLTEIPPLDAVLHVYRAALGKDAVAYRNHTYRVVNLCVGFCPDGKARLEQIAIAAAFHDLGIWTDGTFDYLEPSVRLAHTHLVRIGKPEWVAEVTRMILEHHKLSRSADGPHSLVESFRRADWVDVTKGLVTFGFPRARLSDIFSTWPSAGFHTRLVQLSCRRLLTHPLNPLPMLRL
jgi:hypothetical protein